MTKKKGAGLRIKTEVVIVLVFFACFIVWAISKCNNKKLDYVADVTENTADTSSLENNASDGVSTSLEENASNNDRPQAETTLTAEGGATNSNNPTTITKTVYATKLYVSINGLKLRRAPSVDSPFITTLPLFDELTFLNEVTDSTDIISLAEGIIANEPWVKVRHWKGNEGWVYGAGVHYYKLKYPGLD